MAPLALVEGLGFHNNGDSICPFTGNPCSCGSYDVVGSCPHEDSGTSDDDFDPDTVEDECDELHFAMLDYKMHGELR